VAPGKESSNAPFAVAGEESISAPSVVP
jgi:hypothetical protein